MRPIKAIPSRRIHFGKATLCLTLLFGLNGCSFLIDSASQDFSERLKLTVMEQNDPQTVADALPAYILLQETAARDNGEHEASLLSIANLYGAYLNLIPDEAERKQRLSQKSLEFALRGICVHAVRWCDLQHQAFDMVQTSLQQADTGDIDSLYSVATAWASWIETHKSDWNAIAQLAQVKAIVQRILELDETYKQGSAHLYMAVLESLLPASLGGKPDQALMHFQRAQQLSPANLMVNVLYAKHYARMIFDRSLHDELLNQAISANPEAPGLTLINTLAQQQARHLLTDGEDYF